MEHFLNISVSDPIKRTDGVLSYTTYKVNTQSNRPDMGGTSFSVIRRFNHFKVLHKELSKEFPGAIIPPLPEKSLLNRFEEEFVETRRRNLERFLERVALHLELRTSAHFVKFLTLEESDLAHWEDDPSSEGDGQQGFMGWVKQTVKNAKVLSTQLGATPGMNPNPTPEDLRFEELTTYIKNLEVQMDSVATHARALKERNAALGKGLFDFGLAFTLLGNAETSEIGEALASMGKVADKLSQITTEHAHREAVQFEDPLSDYARIVGAVRVALQKRDEMRVRLGVAQSELALKEAALARVRFVPGKESKVAPAESDVEQAKQAVEQAERVFEEVTTRVIAEVDRFKREKAEDMRRISLDYIRLQIEYNQKVERAWAELLEKFNPAADGAAAPTLPPLQEPTPTETPAQVPMQVPMPVPVPAPVPVPTPTPAVAPLAAKDEAVAQNPEQNPEANAAASSVPEPADDDLNLLM